MKPHLAVNLLDPMFHLSWSLWIQAPLFLALLLVGFRAWFSRPRRVLLPPMVVVPAVLAPCLVAVLLPVGEYHFSGHEGAYGELLRGALPEAGDLTGHRTFALPAGLAWALGRVLPSDLAVHVWFWGNRFALMGLLLLLGGSVCTIVRRYCIGEDDPGVRPLWQVAGALAVGMACLHAPLVGWSATGFAIVPALALGMATVRLGLAKQPHYALAFGAFAIATRMETAPLVLAGLLLCPLDDWKRVSNGPGLWGLCCGLAVLALQAFTLSQKDAELPVEELGPVAGVVLENAGNIGLGGPLLLPAVLALSLLLFLAGPLRPRLGSGFLSPPDGPRTGLVVGLALLAALVQPLFLVDLGARHLQPAVLLVVLIVAPSFAALWRSSHGGRFQSGVCVLFALLLLVPGLVGLRELDRRYMNGFDSLPPSWDATLALAPRGSSSELLRERCYLVLPGGGNSWEGALDTMDVREVHRAAQQLERGNCVYWGVSNDFEFSGDTRSERLDRAVSTLQLVPIAWLDPPPRGDRPWVLLASRPDTSD